MSEVRFRNLLDPSDRARVSAFYRRAADYVLLETGTLPDDSTTDAFFTGAPAAHDPRGDLREGLFRGRELIGICELAFHLPQPGSALITLMILAPAWRGEGLGALWTRRLMDQAKARGMTRLGLSVLRSNPRAREFWLLQGFRPATGLPPGPAPGSASGPAMGSAPGLAPGSASCATAGPAAGLPRERLVQELSPGDADLAGCSAAAVCGLVAGGRVGPARYGGGRTENGPGEAPGPGSALS